METTERGFAYQFKHKQTRKIVIATSWTEFFKLQANKEYNQLNRLGISNYWNWFKDSNNSEERLNSFWSGAIGYEKIGRIDCTGVYDNPIRWFLKNIKNHAAMQGDKETYWKVMEADQDYWSDSSITDRNTVHQLLLTN